LRLSEATASSLRKADLCFIAVPDRLVASVASEVENRLSAKCALVHGAGALSLKVFGTSKRPRGSFHPLVAISDPTDSLEACWAAVSASTSKLRRQLESLARALKMNPITRRPFSRQLERWDFSPKPRA
jgi:predicted short-subunit dehydrogenase-like oxidoreductase (DUF2520 family)